MGAASPRCSAKRRFSSASRDLSAIASWRAAFRRESSWPSTRGPGTTGLLVPEGDAPALADALARLIEQPELRRRLGTAARAVAPERFSALRQSRLLEAALLRVAGLSPP